MDQRIRACGQQLRRALPQGDTLSAHSWQVRHTWICRLLWAHVVVLPAYGLAQGLTVAHALLEGGVLIAGVAVFASSSRLSDAARSLVATLGLVACSAVLVHFSGGVVEMHFHFFVVVIVVSLYQSWRPFLVALGVVILHHGIAGTVDPEAVYNHPSAIANPWAWALVHGGFILGASVACVVAWRLNEDAIERERSAQQSLTRAHDDLAAAQQVAAVGSWEWYPETGELTWSDELYRIFHVDPGLTATLETFLGVLHPDDRDRVSALIEGALSSGRPLDYEARIRTPDGEVRVIHARGTAPERPADAPARVLGTCQDITERKKLEQEVTQRAFHDGLTGLANRALFVDRLDHALAVSERAHAPCVVLYLDLDGFKAVNDMLGHRAGDDLLIEVAQRLQAATRESDTVARLGGDEFAVLLENTRTTDAAHTAERIVRALQEPATVGGRRVTISAGLGMADNRHAQGTDELLHHADLAMYEAKGQRANSYVAFDPRLLDSRRSRDLLKVELAEAIAEEQLVLHYQPVVNLLTSKIESLEALVRWQHPVRGLLPPGEFIELAEQTGLIVDLGRWVTGEATRQAAEMEAEVGRAVHVAVNLSAPQFEDDLVGMVRDALERSGLPSDQLTLEITETCLMSGDEGTVDQLTELRRLGVRIAVDDFGTGYSSLAYLNRLPIDVLKIDRTFVAAVHEGPEGSGLAHAIIKMAGVFGLRTIAEGIELPEQAQALRQLGCRFGQGFLFLAPVPAQELLDAPERWATDSERWDVLLGSDDATRPAERQSLAAGPAQDDVSVE